MTTGRCNVLSVPPGEPFVDAIALGLLEETAEDPLSLSAYTVLLPNRRACRTLRDAFLRVAEGRALVLPALQPIGDVDEESLAFADAAGGETFDLPPAIPPLQRQLVLARLVMAWSRDGAPMPAEHALRLAGDLATLLDQAQTEGVSLDGLERLVPDQYARHWQETLAFLGILRQHWPTFLAEQGYLDPADRRDRALRALAERWEIDPPPGPVIAAGSTGTIPATADLLAVTARLPQGRIVLPGLDRDLDDEAWTLAFAEPAHPQFAIAHLIQHLGVDRDDIADWPVKHRLGLDGDRRAARAGLMSTLMRPAEASDVWRNLPEITDLATHGLSVCEFGTAVDEAGAIALLMRQGLETDEGPRTVALVTFDRGLARRVAAELRRWNIRVDDSAGTPLGDTPPAVFLRLCLEAARSNLAPVPLLALLKHPFAAAGDEPGRFRRAARLLDRKVLRGPRPGPGVAGLRQAVEVSDLLTEDLDDLSRFLDRLGEALGPLLDAFTSGSAPLSDLVDRLITSAEALAETDDSDGLARLWGGEDGEALARFMADLRQHAGAFPPVEPGRMLVILEALLSGQVVRPRFGTHPRAFIWGPLEARLQHADRLILGGLNEGSWPPEPHADPWMSRPMRDEFELPPLERRIGLAAHDFSQAFCAEEVFLTRARKVDGTPTVPSRWLSRLDVVFHAANGGRGYPRDPHWGRWFAELDAPVETRPARAPEPRPPISTRPTGLSVTQIETWIRDPYSIFARHILDLEPIDPLDADPDAADRGIIIHEALETFLKAHPDGLPPAAREALLDCGRRAFDRVMAYPSVEVFWWPRFERFADWFLRAQAERAGERPVHHTEVKGELEVVAGSAPFTLRAKADRIDALADGSYVVIDYKTGSFPTAKDLDRGLASQLPLEAAMVREGAWRSGAIEGKVSRLEYWKASGGNPPGEIKKLKGDPEEQARESIEGLRRLVDAYRQPGMPYRSVPRPALAPRFNDYEHLARRREWTVFDGGSET